MTSAGVDAAWHPPTNVHEESLGEAVPKSLVPGRWKVEAFLYLFVQSGFDLLNTLSQLAANVSGHLECSMLEQVLTAPRKEVSLVQAASLVPTFVNSHEERVVADATLSLFVVLLLYLVFGMLILRWQPNIFC